MPDEILVCPDGQGRLREVGLPRHEHVFDTARAGVALVCGHAGPRDIRGARRLLATADRQDLGVVRGSRGVEELIRVELLDDTSAEGGQIELADDEPDLLDGVAEPMIPHRHRRKVSHDKDPVSFEVGATVKPLGVGFLLGRDVGQTVPDPRHRTADLARRQRPQAVQRLRWQWFDI